MPNAERVEQEFFPLEGGLDLLTPAIALPAGKCFDAQNYEPEITGGYRRVDGYERYDGRASPSAATYWILPLTSTGAIAVGDTITGNTSGATAVVLAITPAGLVLARLVGNFSVSETIRIGA